MTEKQHCITSTSTKMHKYCLSYVYRMFIVASIITVVAMTDGIQTIYIYIYIYTSNIELHCLLNAIDEHMCRILKLLYNHKYSKRMPNIKFG